MASKYLLLFLPTLIHANIHINITASRENDQREKLTVHVSGDNLELISDVELETFGLSNDTLRKAVEKLFGETPTDVFLRSPTPYDDIYKSYHWKQVHRILYPSHAEISTVTSKPEVIQTQFVINNSSKPQQLLTKIQQNIENTATISWDKAGELSCTEDITYTIGFGSITNKTEVSFKGKWGEEDFKTETSTLRLDNAIILLDPNQTVKADFIAAKTTVKTQVDYEAILIGSVAVSYEKAFRGRHFWSWDINEAMKAKNLKNSIKSSEFIKLEYYTGLVVEIRDLESGNVLFSIPFGDSV